MKWMNEWNKWTNEWNEWMNERNEKIKVHKIRQNATLPHCHGHEYMQVDATRACTTMNWVQCHLYDTSVKRMPSGVNPGRRQIHLMRHAKIDAQIIHVYEWTNEWMNWWMNEWRNEWNQWMNEWMNKWMNEWMNGWMNEINEWMNEWMNGWMNEWVDEWMKPMNEWMNE